MKTAQRGFTIVETLLALLVAAVIGFGGYYVWHNQHSKTTTTSPAKTVATNSQPTTSAKVASTFLAFKELGVQITVPETLKGLSYSAREGTSITGEPTTFIYLTSDAFKSFVTSCGGTDTAASFAGINKVTGTYPTNPTPQNSDGALLKQFSGFYIEGSADQQSTPCTTDQDISTLRSSLFSDLATAFKTAALTQ